VQNWYGPPLSPSKYGVDCESCAGCMGRRSVMFFFVTLWNYKVCDNGNAMKQCYFQNNNYGVIACRKICSRAPIFNFFCGPPEFSLRGKCIPKITIFRDFGAVSPHFYSHNGEIWHEGADLGLPPPRQILYKKNRSRGYTPFGQINTKNYQFQRFWGL